MKINNEQQEGSGWSAISKLSSKNKLYLGVAAVVVLWLIFASIGPTDRECHNQAMEKMGWRTQIPTSSWSGEYRDLYDTFYDMCKRGA